MRDARGFTLIELLIVIIILGILSSLAVANYRHARIRGAETAAIAALAAINQAQFAYMRDLRPRLLCAAPDEPRQGEPRHPAAYLSPDLASADEIVKSGYLLRCPAPK